MTTSRYVTLRVILGVLLVLGFTLASPAASAAFVQQPGQFRHACAVCRGSSEEGTECTPSLVNDGYLRSERLAVIADVIRHGRG